MHADLLVSVEPMIERVANGLEYLPDNGGNKNTKLIKLHTRTARALSCTQFTHALKISTGEERPPKSLSRKPNNDK
jgi:hypothetical protein